MDQIVHDYPYAIEHSTFTWLLEPMLARSGFEIKERHLSANGIYAAYVCTRRSRATDS
jgi:hypothetical protein